MTDKIARECDYCHKSDVLTDSADSNGMVAVMEGGWLLLMVDLKPGKLARPAFSLKGKHWHPACLVKALKEWFEKEGVEV